MKKFVARLVSFAVAFGFTTAFAAADVLSPQLFELLEITGVQSEGTLPSIVEATRKSWLRKENLERWELQETLAPEVQAKIAELCDQMGFFEETAPRGTHYTYCCIYGASIPSVKARMLYAKELWDRGVRFDKIILLTGDRPLDERIDRIPELPFFLSNETEAVEKLYELLPLPVEFRMLPVTLVAAPKIGSKRPGAADTVKAWLMSSPLPGTCLMISNQPWVKYHDAVSRCCLPKDFPSETVGNHAWPSYRLRAAVMLDNLARWLYVENQIQTKD